MRTFVIAGGNSGIGLEVSRRLLAEGHRVIMVARDRRKGEAALASFGASRNRAEFLPADLSTHQGCRDAARRISERTERIDGLLHSAAVFETGDERTADGLPLIVALGCMSRYHLTQLLLPRLLQAERPRVMMVTATLKQVPEIDPAPFPFYQPFSFWKTVIPANGVSLYYADYLMKTYPRIFAGCATPGMVRTAIFDRAPWFIRAMVAVTGPFRAVPVGTAAHNLVQALLRGEGSSAFYWNTPGDYSRGFPITVNPEVQKEIIAKAQSITGV
jgi:NAD(P)-dependent dehydrogenase (short-subunit alcohol dehydrogenase family)